MDGSPARERSANDLLQNAVYGDEALEAYFEEHEGNLVQSPKSMLGYNLHPRAKQTITGIAAHILEHIRLTASAQLGRPLRAAPARAPGAVPQFDRRSRQRPGAGHPRRPPRPASTRLISSRSQPRRPCITTPKAASGTRR